MGALLERFPDQTGFFIGLNVFEPVQDLPHDLQVLRPLADGAPVVFGPGEEISIEFGSAAQSPPSDTTRRYWLEVRGWCKDMDLFTRDGETIEPMPGSPVDAGATELLRKSRIRPAGGR